MNFPLLARILILILAEMLHIVNLYPTRPAPTTVISMNVEPSTAVPPSRIHWTILNRTVTETTESATSAATTVTDATSASSPTAEPHQPTETNETLARIHWTISNRNATETTESTISAATTVADAPASPSPAAPPSEPTESILLVPVYEIIFVDSGSADYDNYDPIPTVDVPPKFVQYLPIVEDDEIEWKTENEANSSTVEVTASDKLKGKIIELFRKYVAQKGNNEVADVEVGNAPPKPTQSSKFSSTIIEYFEDNDGNPCVKELVELKTKSFHRYTCELQGTLSEVNRNEN